MTARKFRYCSFCGRGEDAVEWLVTGPAAAAICDQCIALASDIVASKRRDREALRCAGCAPAAIGAP